MAGKGEGDPRGGIRPPKFPLKADVYDRLLMAGRTDARARIWVRQDRESLLKRIGELEAEEASDG